MSQTTQVQQQTDANSTQGSEEVDKKDQPKSRRPPSELRYDAMRSDARCMDRLG